MAASESLPALGATSPKGIEIEGQGSIAADNAALSNGLSGFSVVGSASVKRNVCDGSFGCF